uniref:Uncharacterized protein n=1 Tax=Glossina pallidipes TaxID=7398 RepID=A0A1A9ZJB2_GLOPL
MNIDSGKQKLNQKKVMEKYFMQGVQKYFDINLLILLMICVKFHMNVSYVPTYSGVRINRMQLLSIKRANKLSERNRLSFLRRNERRQDNMRGKPVIKYSAPLVHTPWRTHFRDNTAKESDTDPF